MWVAGQTNANEFLTRLVSSEAERVCRASESSSHLGIEAARPRARRIFYEDLLRQPAHVLLELCQLLDVTYDPNMSEPYDTEAVETFRSAQRVSTTDPKLLRRKKIEAAQADKWRRVKLPQPLSEAAKALARSYGYALS